MLLNGYYTNVSNGKSDGFDDPVFWHYVGVTIRELCIGKFVGLFVVTFLIECLGFHFGRKSQVFPPPVDVFMFGCEMCLEKKVENKFVL
jgi:hypothetical protein